MLVRRIGKNIQVWEKENKGLREKKNTIINFVLMLEIQVSGELLEYMCYCMKGIEGSSPSSRFFSIVLFYEFLNMIMCNTWKLPYFKCKFVLWVLLNAMYNKWAWIWMLLLPLLCIWFYEYNLEFMINWWIWMIINGYMMSCCCKWGRVVTSQIWLIYLIEFSSLLI